MDASVFVPATLHIHLDRDLLAAARARRKTAEQASLRFLGTQECPVALAVQREISPTLRVGVRADARVFVAVGPLVLGRYIPRSQRDHAALKAAIEAFDMGADEYVPPILQDQVMVTLDFLPEDDMREQDTYYQFEVVASPVNGGAE